MADTSLDLLMNPRLKASDAVPVRQQSSSPPPPAPPSPPGFGMRRPTSPAPLASGSPSDGDASAVDEGEEEEDEEGDEDEYEGEGGEDDECSLGGSSSRAAAPRAMTLAEVAAAKKEVLYKLDRLEKHGVKMPRRHTMASDLVEMQSDLDRVQNDRAADASVRFQKRALMTVVSGIEWANSRFDPFDVHLDGWSENIHDNLDDYDEVMEELHQKYRGRGHMAPELKLLMMIVSSGFMFHMSHAFAKNVSRSMNDAMRNDPDLMRRFAAATAGEMGKAGASAPAAAFSAAQQTPQRPPALMPVSAQRGMRGPAGGAPGSGAPLGVSPSRIDEVLRFTRELDEAADGVFDEPPARGLAHASSRPPIPAMTKTGADPPASKPGPAVRAMATRAVPSGDGVEGDSDLFEIMSAASGASGANSGGGVSSATRNGRTRRTLVL